MKREERVQRNEERERWHVWLMKKILFIFLLIDGTGTANKRSALKMENNTFVDIIKCKLLTQKKGSSTIIAMSCGDKFNYVTKNR